MEPLKERIAIKALHPKPQEVDRKLLLVSRPWARP
jgi:hypothetical protein